jgi:prepilin-type N-terminal cleavage/methylation domain-containing protein/prepilin-type processing-associated H-X9-DG protein
MQPRLALRPVHRGFTLLELLVVVALIAVLTGMLLSSVRIVREAANATACASNLRQLQLANATYKSDQGYWMPGYDVSFSGNNFWIKSRDFLALYTDGKVTDADNNRIPRRQLCPDSRPPVSWDSLSFSYGYNCNATFAPANQPWYYHPSDADIVSFADGLDWLLTYGGLPNYYVTGSPKPEGLRSKTSTAFRHHGRANVAFYDGHVAATSYVELNRTWLWQRI